MVTAHPITKIGEQAPAPTQLAKTDTATQLTRIAMAGHELFNAIDTTASAANTTLQALRKVALETGLTVDEFDNACKIAQKDADTADATGGFKAADDAKGAEKYGPKRRVLNQRLSEAKQLFGVFKLEPDLLEGKGYWPALESAREYLKAQGIKWDGSINTAEAKAERKDAKLTQKAITDTMKANPHMPGESLADYNARVTAIAEEALETAKQEQFTAEITRVFTALQKAHSKEFLDSLALTILSQDPSEHVRDAASQLMEIADKLEEQEKGTPPTNGAPTPPVV